MKDMVLFTRDNSKQEEEKEKRETKRWLIGLFVVGGIGVTGLVIAILAYLK